MLIGCNFVTLQVYIANKPNPYGVKIFTNAAPDGYIWHAVPYSASSTITDTVLSLMTPEMEHKGHVVFTDRYEVPSLA